MAVTTDPACGSWWQSPSSWQQGDEQVLTTFAGNSSYDVDEIDSRCGGCFIFHLHNGLNCDLGIISYLHQGSSFDSMAFVAVMGFIMLIVSIARTQAGRAPPHAILPHLNPVSSNWRHGWRGWAFTFLVFACTANVVQSKLIFTFANETRARHINIVLQTWADVLMASLLVLLQSAWFLHHTSHDGGMANAYHGPRRPPAFLRLWSVLGLVCSSPRCVDCAPRDSHSEAGVAENLCGHKVELLRLHMHARRTRIVVRVVRGLMALGFVLYPIAAINLVLWVKVEHVNTSRLMVPKSDGAIPFFNVAYYWYQLGAFVLFSDLVLAMLVFNSFGFGSVFPIRLADGIRRRTSVDGAAASAGPAGGTNGKSASAPQHANVGDGGPAAVEVQSRSATVSGKVWAHMLTVARARNRWLRKIAAPRAGPTQAMPGRLDSEAATDVAWLLAICSFFPVIKALVGMTVMSGNFCPYTTAENDPRGDPYEQPWHDVWNFMQVLCLLFLFSFDSFPRKLTTTIANFTGGASLVEAKALKASRGVTILFAVSFAFNNRFTNRKDADLVDELFFTIAFGITMSIVSDVRAWVVMVLPIDERTKADYRKRRAASAGSLVVAGAVLALLVFWITIFISPRIVGRIGKAKKIGMNIGVVVWPACTWLVVRVAIALFRPSERKEVLDVTRRKYDASSGTPATRSALAVPLTWWNVMDDVSKIVSVAVAAWVVWSLLLTTLALLVVYGVAIYLSGLVASHVLRDDSVVAADDGSSVDAEELEDRARDRPEEQVADVTANDGVTVEGEGIELGAVDAGDGGDAAVAGVREASGGRGGSGDRGGKDVPPPSSVSRGERLKKRSIICAAQMGICGVLFLFSHVWYINSNALIPYNVRPLVIGHRGVWVDGVPELSKEAADRAKAAGFDGVEFDVRLSKDGIPVLMHDETLERTTTGTGNVWDYTFAELQTLELLDADPSRNETVYSLDEYLEYLKALELIAEIELKQGNSGDIVTKSLDAVCRAGYTEKSFIATAEFTFQNILWVAAPGMTLEKDFLYHIPANAMSVPQNSNILGIADVFVVITVAHRAKMNVIVYFLLLEGAWMYDLLGAWGVDLFMVNDDTVCLDAGLCPSNSTLTRTMCADAPDGSEACTLSQEEAQALVDSAL